jgi:nitrous oxidase accessory protein NosD
MYIPVLLESMPSNILIENNVVSDINATAFSLIQIVPSPLDAPPQNLVVRGNHVSGKSLHPFVLRALNGVEFTGNTFEGSSDSAQIGFHDPATLVRGFAMRGNTFAQCGNVTGTGITVFRVDGLMVRDNEFSNCGNGNAQSTVFDFAAGTSAHVTIQKNRFLSPQGKSKFVARVESGHASDRDSTVFGLDNTVQPGMDNSLGPAAH